MKISVSIDISSIQFNVDAINNAVSQELERTAYLCERTAKSLVPVDTGSLRNSINVDGGGLEWTISPNMEYDYIIEEGASPHMIYGNPILHWGDVYTRQVHHPGNKAYLYMWGAFQTHTVDLVDRVALAVMKVL